MAAERFDFTIEQGATFKWYITINDPDAPTEFLDLTTYLVRSQARSKYESASPAFTFTCIIQDQVTDTGKVLLYLADEATAVVAKGNYVYDVELESSGGEVVRLYQGRITVSPEATRA